MKPLPFILLLTLAAFVRTYSQNNPPVAVNDTISGFFGYPIQVHLLQNDYDPDGDSIYVSHNPSYTTRINDSTWEFFMNGFSVDYATSRSFLYMLKDQNGASTLANLVFNLKSPLRYEMLDINNINALISPVGQHFWDFETARFEVPKGSGKMALLNHAVWIGGLDAGGNLHMAAERYRQSGADFVQGPISTVHDSTFLKKWNSVWKLSKPEIEYHIANWNHTGYQPISAIKTWPAHGDILQGQTADIAPFYDHDNNGTYDPYAGDYPLIRGDQAIFFIINDSARIHTESHGQIAGIEIHGMAYAFNQPGDSLLFNTIFFHYDILNRSALDYHEAYIGLFTDFDLGNPVDDYIGCDVVNGMTYAYNGDDYDEDSTFLGGGSYLGYGANPPALGVKVIGGPYLTDDGIDNPANGCDNSINGLNFGDNIIDNERMGLTNSVNLFNSTGPYYMTDPQTAPDYYQLARSIWRDATHMVFGGHGHINSGGVGPECEYMFPDNSDTLCNWGTQGVPPNGGYNQNGKFWTESEAGNAPGDRRGVSSVGPFTMNAGQSVPFDYCFTFAWDNSTNLPSAKLLKNRVSTLSEKAADLISLPLNYTLVINESAVPSKLSIIPNPAKNWITIVTNEKTAQPFYIFDLNGKTVTQGILHEGNTHVDIEQLKAGVYVVKSGSRWARFVKM